MAVMAKSQPSKATKKKDIVGPTKGWSQVTTPTTKKKSLKTKRKAHDIMMYPILILIMMLNRMFKTTCLYQRGELLGRRSHLMYLKLPLTASPFIMCQVLKSGSMSFKGGWLWKGNLERMF